MNDRRHWYIADALMADLTNHHHHLRAASEEEVEGRMLKRYPEAVALLVRLEESWRQDLSSTGPVP
jgi:hypothetical protein